MSNTILQFLPGDICVVKSHINKLGSFLCEIITITYVPHYNDQYYEALYNVKMLSSKFNIFKNFPTYYELCDSQLDLFQPIDLNKVVSWDNCPYKPPYLKEKTNNE